MAGLYIHIPFCQKRCIYCDFFSSTDNNQIERYLHAVNKELTIRSSFFANQTIETIYIGGGTPSQISIIQLAQLFRTLAKFIPFDQVKECTIEANPDDLTLPYLQGLRTLPINRLSIGIQSFQDHHLHFLNRRHTAAQAICAIDLAQQLGFDNISIDLMFGLPNQNVEEWNIDLLKATTIGVQHISAYCLTYEPDTHLYKKLQADEVEEINDEAFEMLQNSLINTLKSTGFDRYEVSNYAQKGFESKHNSNYWRLTPYIGIGASAHSFHDNIRSWNPSSIQAYCQQMDYDSYSPQEELLSPTIQLNEYIMLRLRTCKGISTKEFEYRFGEISLNRLINLSKKFIDSKHLHYSKHYIACTDEGFNIMNLIITELME